MTAVEKAEDEAQRVTKIAERDRKRAEKEAEDEAQRVAKKIAERDRKRAEKEAEEEAQRVKKIAERCDNIHPWICTTGDLAFSHQQEFTVLNSQKGFRRSLPEISLFSQLFSRS